MATVTKTATRTIHIASDPPYAGGMTVSHLRDFVRALDAEGIRGDTRLDVHRDNTTMHLVSLSVRITSAIPDEPTTTGDDGDPGTDESREDS